VSPGQTQNCDNPIHLEIVTGGGAAHRGEGVPGIAGSLPHPLHYSPKARKRKQLDAKRLWNAETGDHLTKAFTKTRDDSETHKEMPNAERPTFHEIRALGAWLNE
jgi:hypothetical protein